MQSSGGQDDGERNDQGAGGIPRGESSYRVTTMKWELTQLSVEK